MTGSGNAAKTDRARKLRREQTETERRFWYRIRNRQLAGYKFVRQELKLPPERYELVGYWIANGEDWDAKWKALDPHIKAQIDAAWDSGRDREEVRDEYEATLEKYGL